MLDRIIMDTNQSWKWFLRKRRGQDLTEYAFLVALIAIVVMLAVIFFGESLSSFWSEAADTVSGLLAQGD